MGNHGGFSFIPIDVRKGLYYDFHSGGRKPPFPREEERTMKHKVKVTVLDQKLYPELQRQYCADANAGPCPCYHVGDEFVFLRDD